MEVLSVLNLGEFAHIFSKIGMFPVFDLAYYIVSILYLKYEPGEILKKTPSVCLKWECFQLESLLSIGLFLKNFMVAGPHSYPAALNMYLFTSAQSRNIFLHYLMFRPLQWGLSKMKWADLQATFVPILKIPTGAFSSVLHPLHIKQNLLHRI